MIECFYIFHFFRSKLLLIKIQARYLIISYRPAFSRVQLCLFRLLPLSPHLGLATPWLALIFWRRLSLFAQIYETHANKSLRWSVYIIPYKAINISAYIKCMSISDLGETCESLNVQRDRQLSTILIISVYLINFISRSSVCQHCSISKGIYLMFFKSSI